MRKVSRESKDVFLFFIFTFLLSWILWFPFVLSGFGIIELSEEVSSLMSLAVMLGAFSPLFSALMLILHNEGKEGVKNFFKRSLSLKTKPVYYLLAFTLPFLTAAVAHYFVNISGLDTLPANLFPEDIGIPVIALVVPYLVLIMIVGGGQEEFGWRGYAQEPLQKKFGILYGSLILGFMWALWHLPLWFMPGEGHAFYPFIAFVLYTMSTSITIGWLYNASGKKLIIPWVLHSIGNVSVPFFPIMHMKDVPQPGYWVWVVTNIILAIVVTMVFKKKESKYSD